MHKSHYENPPFEIPESWCWTTLGELCTFLSRGKSPKYSEERIYPVFAQKCNLKDGGISLEQARFLDPDTICKWDSKYKLRNGDVLVNSTGTGTVGRTRLFNESCLGEYPFVVPDSHISVVRASAYMETKYVLAILTSQWGQQYIEDNLAGSTNQKELYIRVLEDMFFPLPPFDEQRRITKELEKWGNTVDNIDIAKSELTDKVKSIKSKILDLAISGKLVPQDPADEPAIDLLKRTNPNFVPCDNSHYENLPFEIPESWCWCNGEHIFLPMISCKPTDEFFKYIDIESIDNKNHKLLEPKVLKSINAPSRASRYTKKGDVLFSMVRPYLKNIALVDEDNFIASTGFYICSPSKLLISNYCYYMMLSNYVVNGLNQFMKGDNSPSINNSHITSWLYPIPPLEEQRRIVDRIESLYKYLNTITAEL